LSIATDCCLLSFDLDSEATGTKEINQICRKLGTMNWRFLREINDKVWNRMASDIQSGGAKLAAYVKQNPRVFLYAARDFVVVFGFVHITTNYVGNITLVSD